MAIKSNLIIDQGADYVVELDVADANGNIIDLTGHTANAQLRKHYSSNTNVAFSAGIDANNKITLTLTAAQTANIVAGRYVYDVKISANSGIVTRVLEGVVTVTPRVTR